MTESSTCIKSLKLLGKATISKHNLLKASNEEEISKRNNKLNKHICKNRQTNAEELQQRNRHGVQTSFTHAKPWPYL